MGIWNEIYLQEALIEGLGVLNKIQPFAWIAFAIFIILEIVCFHVQIMEGVKSIASILRWALGDCKIDTTLESIFDTPPWEDAENYYIGT